MKNSQLFSKIVNSTSKTTILIEKNFTGRSYFLSNWCAKVKKRCEVAFGVQMASKGNEMMCNYGNLIQIGTRNDILDFMDDFW